MWVSAPRGFLWMLVLWVFSSCSEFGKIRLVGRSGVLLGPGTQGWVYGWKGLTNGTWTLLLRKPSAISLESFFFKFFFFLSF